MPYHGCPKSSWPAASAKPCPGKYIDIYVGCIDMWIVSKWVHIAGVGLASRPCAKVSAARRKLKSSGAKGCGMGHNGIIAKRNNGADNPTTTTARFLFRANCRNICSTREKLNEPSPGHANDTTMAMAVRPTSIAISEGAVPEREDWSISVFRGRDDQTNDIGTWAL